MLANRSEDKVGDERGTCYAGTTLPSCAWKRERQFLGLDFTVVSLPLLEGVAPAAQAEASNDKKQATSEDDPSISCRHPHHDAKKNYEDEALALAGGFVSSVSYHQRIPSPQDFWCSAWPRLNPPLLRFKAPCTPETPQNSTETSKMEIDVFTLAPNQLRRYLVVVDGGPGCCPAS